MRRTVFALAFAVTLLSGSPGGALSDRETENLVAFTRLLGGGFLFLQFMDASAHLASLVFVAFRDTILDEPLEMITYAGLSCFKAR